MGLTTAAILALLIVCTTAGPLQWRDAAPFGECSATCPESGSGLGYELGKVYEYAYRTTTRTEVTGDNGNDATLHVSANVRLHRVSRCEFQLAFSDVSLADSSRSEGKQTSGREQVFAEGLTSTPLRFAVVDGLVENVCPGEEEPAWATNVKRAFLSTLQHGKLDKGWNTETDVSGVCPVENSVVESGRSGYTVRKTKDLGACLSRQNLESVIQASAYRTHSKLQSAPLLDEKFSCDLTVNSDEVVTGSKCSEKLRFRPFSRSGSDTQTIVESELSLKNVARESVPEGRVTRRLPMTFAHQHDNIATEELTRQTEELLASLCDSSSVTPETPTVFNKLVAVMRRMDSDTLERVHGKASCQMARKLVRDAVPMLGSSAAVAFIRQQIESGRLSDVEAELWLTSVAFVPRPTSDMLVEVKSLLRSRSPLADKIYMSVSALIHSYCQHHDCRRDAAVHELTEIFVDNLGSSCRSRDDEQRQSIIRSLKAIGNAGHADERTGRVLGSCAVDDQNDRYTRISAMLAFRRMPCDAQLTRPEVMTMFRTGREDSEIRIHAYLAMMRCPSEKMLERVRDALLREESNQVGSFVWTHLTNMAESSSPFKMEAARLLRDHQLVRIFNEDVRKFSRNVEWSAFSEWINSGASLDANFIWSSESFLPRSASLNLTVDLFGQSVNLMEVGARAEGFESLLHSLLVKDESEEFDALNNNEIKKLDDKHKIRSEKGVRGSYYLRVFGNEMRFGSVEGLDLKAIQQKLNFLQWLLDASNEHKFDFTKAIQVINSDLCVPTSAGLPLRLHVEATAVVDVSMNGKVDLRQISTPPRSLEISGTVKPSAALEVSSSMEVDAFVEKIAVRMSTTSHTSTIADGAIVLRDGKIFSADINTPKDKMEVFNVRTSSWLLHRNHWHKLERPTETKRRCESVMGVQLCGQISLDKVHPYSTIPALASIELTKTESYKKIHFSGEIINNRDERGLTIEFDTPESETNRKLLLAASLKRTGAGLLLETPWKKLDVRTSVVDNPELKALRGHVLMDGVDKYEINAEVDIKKTRFNVQYLPRLTILSPSGSLLNADSRILYRSGRKASLSLKIEDLMDRPITCKGELEINKENYNGDLTVSANGFDLEIHSNNKFLNTKAKKELNTYNVVEYKMGRSKQSLKIDETFSCTEDELTSNFNLKSSAWPKANSQMKMNLKKEGSMNKMQMSANGFGEQGQLNYEWTSMYKSGESLTLNGKASLDVPSRKISHSYEINHKHGNEGVESRGSLKINDGKLHSRYLVDLRRSNNMNDYNGIIELRVPRNQLSLKGNVVKNSKNSFSADADLALNDKHAVFNGVYKGGRKHEVTSAMKLSNWNDELKFEGKIVPEVEDFMIESELSKGSKVYKTSATLSLGEKKEGQLSMSYPGNKFTSRFQVERSGKTHKLKTEFRIGNNASYKLVGKLRPVLRNLMTECRVDWPKNFVELTAAARISGYNWNGDGKVSTSLRGMENAEFSFENKLENSKLESHAAASWTQGRRIEARLKAEKQNGSGNLEIDLKTPIRWLRSSKNLLSYRLNGGDIDAIVDTDVNGNKNVLKLDGSFESVHSMSGKLSILSSAAGDVGVMMVSGSHKDNGRKFVTSLTTSLGGRPTGNINVKFNHRNSRSSLQNSGTITLDLPKLRQARNQKLEWLYKHGDGQAVVEMFLTNAHGKTSLNVDGELKLKKVCSVKLNGALKSPYQYTRDMAISVAHKHHRDSLKDIQSEGFVRWAPNKQINVHLNMDIDSKSKNVDMKANVDTPFRQLKNIEAIMKSTQKDNEMMSHTAFVYNDHRYTCDTKFVGNHTAFKYSRRLLYNDKTIFYAELNNKKEGSLWLTDSIVEYQPGKEIKMNTVLGFKEEKKLDIFVESPCPYLRQLQFNTAFEGRATRFNVQNRFSLTTDEEVYRANTENKINFDDWSSVSGSLTVKSNLPVVRDTEVKCNHVSKRGGRYSTNIELQSPYGTYSMSHETSVPSTRDIISNAKINVNGDRTNVEAKWRRTPALTAAISITTPYQPLRTASIAVNHNGNSEKFDADASLQFNGRQVNGELQSEIGRTIRVKSTLRTPFSGWETITGNLQHREIENGWITEAEAQWNSNTIRFNQKMQLERNQIRYDGELNTPWEFLRKLDAKFNAKGKLRNFRQEASLSLNNQKFEQRAEFKLLQKTIKASGSVEIPEKYGFSFEKKDTVSGSLAKLEVEAKQKSVKINANYELTSKMVKSAVAVRTPFDGYNTIRYYIMGEKNKGRCSVDVTVETPFSQFRKVHVESNSEFDPMELKHNSIINIDGDKYEVNYNHQISDVKMTSNALVETTLAGYEKLSYSFVLDNIVYKDLLITNMDLDLHVITPFKRFESTKFHGKWEITEEKWTTEVSLKTSYPQLHHFSANIIIPVRHEVGAEIIVQLPFDKLRKLNLLAKYNAARKFAFNFDAEPIKYSLSMNLDDERAGYTGNVQVKTPFENYENNKLVVKFKQERKLELDVLATTTSRNPDYRFNFSFEGVPRNFETEFKLITPFSGYRDINGKFAHKGGPSRFNCRAQLEIDGHSSTLEHIFAISRNDLTQSLQIRTPFRSFDKFGYSVEANMRKSGISAKLHVDTPCRRTKNIDIEFDGVVNAGQVNSHLSVETGHKDFKRAHVSISREGDERSWVASAKIESPFERFTHGHVTVKHESDDDKINSGVYIGTSYPGYEKISLESNYQRGENQPFRMYELITNVPVYGMNGARLHLQNENTSNGFATEASIKTSATGHELYEAGVKYHKNAKKINFQSSVRSPIDGFKQFAASGTVHSDSLDAKVETPFRNFEVMSGKLQYQNKRGKIEGSALLQSSYPGMKRFFSQFDLKTEGSTIETTATLETPFRALKKSEIKVNFDGENVSASMSRNRQSVNVNSSYTKNNGRYIFRSNFESSSRRFESGSLECTVAIKGGNYNNELLTTFNNRKMIDMKGSLELNERKELSIEVEEPRQMNVRATYERSGKRHELKAETNWNKQEPTSWAKASVNFDNQREKNVLVQFSIDRLMLKSKLSVESHRMKNSGNIEVNGKTSSYNVEIIRDGKDDIGRNMYELQGSIRTPTRIHSIGATHACGRRNSQTRVALDDYTVVYTSSRENKQFEQKLSVSHPSFKRDVVVESTGSINVAKIEGTIKAQFSEQTIEFYGKIARENGAYVANCQLKHPTSSTDFNFESRSKCTHNESNFYMQAQYLMASDNRMKKMMLRSDYNRPEKTVVVEMHTPIAKMNIRGQKSSENMDSTSFDIAGRFNENDVEGRITVDHDKPTFDCKLNVGSDMAFRARAKVTDDKDIAIEMFQIIDGVRQEDSEVVLRIDEDNVINLRGFLRPSVWQDIKDQLNRINYRPVRRLMTTLSKEWQLKRQQFAESIRPCTEICQRAYDSNTFFVRDIVDAGSKLTKTVSKFINEWRNVASEISHSVTRHLRTAFEDVYEFIGRQSAWLGDAYNRMDRAARPWVRKQLKTVRYQANRLQNFCMDMISQLPGYESWENTSVQEIVASITDRLSLQKYTERLVELCEYLGLRPQMAMLKDWLKEAYEYLEIDERLERVMPYVREFRGKGLQFVRERIVGYLRDAVHYERNRLVEWNPQEGKFEVQMFVPRSVTALPNLGLSEAYSKVRHVYSRLNALMPESDIDMAELYYKYKPESLNPRDWIPPYPSHASIRGSHIQTFDHKYYDFVGDCSYLLTRDFQDGKFTVIVNYKNGQKSITVISGDSEIEITPDYKLKVRGRSAELPYNAKNLQVTSEDQKICIETPFGFSMECSEDSDSCVVNVNGWYHGKLGGLFGNFNNEQYDETGNSIHGMASSWSLGSRCSGHNLAGTEVEHESRKICDRMFGRESQFRRCFGVVNPRPFQRMCERTKPKRICKVAAHYVHDCRAHNVKLRLPKICAKCELDGGIELENGETRQVTLKEKSDVVFVVSHGECNRDMKNKLASVAEMMKRRSQRSDVKFALVGFGDRRIGYPHVHTLNGREFGTDSEFQSAIKRFETEGTEPENAMDAVNFASSLSFRNGATKTVVLVACDTCSDDGMKFSGLLNLLSKKNIKMHMLIEQDISIGKKNGPLIFGITSSGVFTSQNAYEVDGDSDLRSYVAEPKDHCAAVALESSGSVFNSHWLASAKPKTSKKFRDIFARVVVNRGTPDVCQNCVCVTDELGRAHAECRACENGARPQEAGKGAPRSARTTRRRKSRPSP